MGIFDNEKEEQENNKHFEIKPIGDGFVPFTLGININTMEDLKSYINLFVDWDDDISDGLINYEKEMERRMGC